MRMSVEVIKMLALLDGVLERETPEFISPILWFPNSPDLNPVNYSVWSILQERVYKTRITDLDDLKHCVKTEWPPGSCRHCCSCASVASPSFSLCQGGQWSFRALLLILTLCFCDNCGLWLKPSLTSQIKQFLTVVNWDIVRFSAWRSF